VNLHDSVHVGDIVQNVTGTNECPNCKTTNVPVFSCMESNCSERWCTYCGPEEPGYCASCIEDLQQKTANRLAEKSAERKAKEEREEAEFLARMRVLGASKKTETVSFFRLWRTPSTATILRTHSTLAILLGWSVFFLTEYQFILEHNVVYTFVAIASLGWWISAMIAFGKRKLIIGGLETLVLVSLPYLVSIIPIFIGPIFFIISFFIAIYAYYERPL